MALTSDEAVRSALARVLGHSSSLGLGGVEMRSDTVLADLGVDNLARVLLMDACADLGVALDEDAAWAARTVGDLVESARR